MGIFRKVRAIISSAKEFIYADEDVQKLSESRLEICRSCVLRQVIDDVEICSKAVSITTKVKVKDKETGLESKVDRVVTGCGCSLKLKSVKVKNNCPLGKWIKPIIDIKNDSKELRHRGEQTT